MPEPWKGPRLDRLRFLAAERCSAATIAIALGCSRNAVVGAAHRYGVQLDGDGSGGANQRLASMARRTQARARRQGRAVAARVLPPAPLPQVVDPMYVAPVATTIYVATPFRDLISDQCRWIAGEPGHDAPACGARTSALMPYCAAHLLRAYVPAAQRRSSKEVR